jgi:hypothetical protein
MGEGRDPEIRDLKLFPHSSALRNWIPAFAGMTALSASHFTLDAVEYSGLVAACTASFFRYSGRRDQ